MPYLPKCMICGFIFHLIIISLSYADISKIEITFINPGVSNTKGATGSFWVMVSEFMQAAANDLNINLEIIYSERNHIQMKQEAFKVLNRKNRPDYLIVVNEMVQAGPIVEMAEQKKVKLFLAFNAFTDKQSLKFGAPREKYKFWIGSLVPNNTLAGYLMADRIFAKAQSIGSKNADDRIHMIAIAGDHVTQASIERVKGLNQFIMEHTGIILQQTFFAQWSSVNARYITSRALGRYPQTNAVWCANDPIAIGALEALRDAGKLPGREVFVSGLNWSLPALAEVQKGTFVTSVGGHFMTGGWALVLLYDYHHGKDFSDEGVALNKQIFSAIDQNNVDHYLTRFGDQKWDKIDFKKFSKVLNPTVKTYDFSLERILHQ